MLCKSGIYKIVNLVNGKVYVGSAVNLRKRKSYHLCDLRKGIHKNQHLQKSFNKHGEISFKFCIVEIVDDKSQLIEREQYYIDLHNATNRKHGFNIRLFASSNLGMEHSIESKIKISESRKGKCCGHDNPFYGKRHPDEIMQKINEKKRNVPEEIRDSRRRQLSESHKGKKLPEEQKRKISEANKGKRCGADNPNYSGKYSNKSPVINLDENKIFSTIADAARFYGINHSHISSACRGKDRRKRAGGYHWAYYEEREGLICVEQL